jgi:NADH-quinone oxidoreductase subunit J
MVLYVFVVAYIGGHDEPLGPHAGRGLRAIAGTAAAALFVALCIAVLGTGLQAVGTEGPRLPVTHGGPAQLGELLLTRYLLAFEVASFLLLVAAVGAVVLARRRGGLQVGDEARISAAEIARIPGTGTMREGVRGDVGQVEHRPLAPVGDPGQTEAGGDPLGRQVPG